MTIRQCIAIGILILRIGINHLFVEIKQTVLIRITQPRFRQIFQAAEIVSFGCVADESCQIAVAIDVHRAAVDDNCIRNDQAVQIDIWGINGQRTQRGINQTVDVCHIVGIHSDIAIFGVQNRIVGIGHLTGQCQIHEAAKTGIQRNIAAYIHVPIRKNGRVDMNVHLVPCVGFFINSAVFGKIGFIDLAVGIHMLDSINLCNSGGDFAIDITAV